MLKKGEVVPFEQKADFYFRRGDIHLENNELLSALSMYQIGARMQSDQLEGWQKVSKVYARMQCFDLSNRALLNCFWRCKDLPPELSYELGSNFIGLHEYEWAMAFFQRYAEESGDEDAAQKLEILRLIGQMSIDEAGDEDDSYLTEDEMELRQVTRMLEMQSRQLLQRGKIQEAKKLLEQSSSLMPNVSRLLEFIAWIELQEGNLEEAAKHIKQLLQTDPLNISAHCIRLYINEKTDIPDEKAEESIQILKECRPQNDEDAYQAALILAHLGYYGQAYKFSKIALDFTPYHPDYIHACAACAYHLGKFEKARKLWAKLAILLPNDPVASYYSDLIKKDVTLDVAIPLKFNLPVAEQLHAMRTIRLYSNEISVLSQDHNEELFKMLLWALYYGEENLRPLIIKLLAKQFVFEAPDILREFLMLPNQSDEHKHEAIKVLSYIGAEQPFYALFESGVAQVWEDPKHDDHKSCF